MGREVHRDADMAVPERLHHDARVNPLRNQQGGTGVPEIVQTEVNRTGFLGDLISLAQGVLVEEWRSDFRSEGVGYVGVTSCASRTRFV
jgi:hypothetical protein